MTIIHDTRRAVKSYVDGATHHGLPFGGFVHDVEQVCRKTLH